MLTFFKKKCYKNTNLTLKQQKKAIKKLNYQIRVLPLQIETAYSFGIYLDEVNILEELCDLKDKILNNYLMKEDLPKLNYYIYKRKIVI
jgi:hypothetical protein